MAEDQPWSAEAKEAGRHHLPSDRLATIMGILSGLIAVVQFAREHILTSLLFGVLFLGAAAFHWRQSLFRLLGRHRREILAGSFGAALGFIAGALAPWSSYRTETPSLGLVGVPPAASTPQITPPIIVDPPPPVSGSVYRTPKGEKYHRADCWHLEGREVSMLTLAEAEKQGLTACKVCKPPALP